MLTSVTFGLRLRLEKEQVKLCYNVDMVNVGNWGVGPLKMLFLPNKITIAYCIQVRKNVLFNINKLSFQ